MVKRFLKQHFNLDINFRTNFMVSGSFDVVFACLVMALFTVGLIAMYSASYADASYYNDNSMKYFGKQLLFGIVGFFLMILVSKIDYKAYNSGFACFAYFATLAVLGFALVYSKLTHKDTGRWLFGIQPSEFAKVTLIIVMSYMICALKTALRTNHNAPVKISADRRKFNSLEMWIYNHVHRPVSAAAILAAITGSYAVMVLLGKHYSGAIVIFCIGFVLSWLSGAKHRYFLAVGAVIVVALIVILSNPEILKGFGNATTRLIVWLRPEEATKDQLQQTNNGLYAIASGGLFGVGFGNSVQKQLYIPEPQNDFVFTIFCEEFGFLGAVFVVVLFAVLILRGMSIATKCNNYFGSLLVMGVMIMISLQVIFNIAVVTNLFPNTGMPLPFFSYGGSSLIAIMMAMGIVLSVSRDSKIEKE